jgi:hypothetical protein
VGKEIDACALLDATIQTAKHRFSSSVLLITVLSSSSSHASGAASAILFNWNVRGKHSKSCRQPFPQTREMNIVGGKLRQVVYGTSTNEEQ